MRTLGIDLGGTFARAAVVDPDGGLVASAKTALTQRSPEAVVEAIAQAAESAVLTSKVTAIDSVGVGVAGQLGPNGWVRVGPNLGWRDVPFGPMLSSRLGRPVHVFNDLVCAAWGEYLAGSGKGFEDLWVVFVGSGVGSAIISQGRLVRGASGVAGELGHTKVVRDGRQCGCGEHGCLEAYCGGHNLIAQMNELMQAAEPTSLTQLCGGDPKLLTPALLENAALAADVPARRLYDQVASFLALAIANGVTLLNPSRVILGGGVLHHAPGLREAVRQGVAHYSLAVSRAAVQVVEASLGDDSGLIGAGLLAAAAVAQGQGLSGRG